MNTSRRLVAHLARRVVVVVVESSTPPAATTVSTAAAAGIGSRNSRIPIRTTLASLSTLSSVPKRPGIAHPATTTAAATRTTTTAFRGFSSESKIHEEEDASTCNRTSASMVTKVLSKDIAAVDGNLNDHNHVEKNDNNDDDDEMEQEDMFVEPHDSFEFRTLEWGGPRRGGRLPEPTRYGDWERKGRCTDF